MYMSSFFFFKQKTAYEMRISDWSSDVCSSDLKADNTLAAGNAGLITGGFSATGFGGTVSLDNSGTIHNGLTLAGKGDTELKSTGGVRSGDVVAASVQSVKSTVSGNTTTDVYSSGDVTAAVADVASADGKTKGGATFYAEYRSEEHTSELQLL